jgi:hypothetical protein
MEEINWPFQLSKRAFCDGKGVIFPGLGFAVIGARGTYYLNGD